MGIEIEVNSLEEMCTPMCDNRIPKQKQKKDKKADAPDKTECAQPDDQMIISFL